MKIYYIVVLFVLFSQTMTYRHKKIKAINTTTKQKCEKIKCPLIDDPVCVKMKNKHKKEVYIIAINKCEMKYASCHKDVEATIEPMVNCLQVRKRQNIARKRNKRDLEEIFTEDDSKGQSGDDENEVKLLKGQSNDNESGDNIGNEDNELTKEDYLSGSPWDFGKILKDEDDPMLEIDDNDITKLISVDNVGADYDQHHEEVDLDENNKNCPTVCPSRDVMICAKCQHDIYRTFLSLCHLRMFACKHKTEKLRLVKREPCVQSAPLMLEFKETKGRIPESGELDEVHKFIFCRNQKLLKKDDPRC